MAKKTKTKLPRDIAKEFNRKVKELRDFMNKNGIRVAYDTTGGIHRFAVLPDGFWPISRRDKDYDRDGEEFCLDDFTKFDPSYVLTPFFSGRETIQKVW